MGVGGNKKAPVAIFCVLSWQPLQLITATACQIVAHLALDSCLGFALTIAQPFFTGVAEWYGLLALRDAQNKLRGLRSHSGPGSGCPKRWSIQCESSCLGQGNAIIPDRVSPFGITDSLMVTAQRSLLG